MKLIQGPVSFTEVLPSAVVILMLGAGLSWFNYYFQWFGSWQWFGQLGWLAVTYGVILGVVIYLLGFALSCSPWTKTKSMHRLLTTLHQLFQNFTWPQIVAVSVLAGVGEELLIRAVLQVFLVDNVGAFWGVFGASLIFGLLHFMTKTYVLLTFALGLLFGVAFHYFNSIVVVMIGHTVYDIIAFAMIVKFPHILGIKTSHAKIITTDSL